MINHNIPTSRLRRTRIKLIKEFFLLLFNTTQEELRCIGKTKLPAICRNKDFHKNLVLKKIKIKAMNKLIT